MKNDTSKWSFIGAGPPVLILIVLAVVGVLPTWITTIAAAGGIGIMVLCSTVWERVYWLLLKKRFHQI